MSMFTFINGQPAGERYFDANCGGHFNEYVKRNRTVDFDYNQFNGGMTTHDDLWKRRRLRIKMHSSPSAGWREAKVVEWVEYLIGPFAPEARWAITIEFTDIGDVGNDGGTSSSNQFELGDVVEIHGLIGAPQHNEKVGSIVKLVEDSATDRYGVQYDDKNLAVKPKNLRRVKELKFGVHRCNIEGGGILVVGDSSIRPCGPGDSLSFEWLDEASPKINLAEEPWELACPTCRKVTTSEQQPSEATEAANKSTAECPVCLDTKECQSLVSCSHRFCSSCLMRCRTKSGGSSFFSIEDVTVDLSPEEIALRLKKNANMIPNNRCNQDYVDRFTEICRELGEMTEDGELSGLKQFKQWILTHPLELWGPSSLVKFLCKQIGIEAAEILLAHMESLRGTDEYKNFVEGVMKDTKKFGEKGVFRLSGFPADGDAYMSDPDNYHGIVMLHLTEMIAMKYEEIGDYYPAIRWYEKNIGWVPSNFNLREGHDTMLAASLGNLGLAQKEAGLYQTALETYNRAFELDGRCAQKIRNKQILQDEIDEWIGTSGHATPRLDE